jgi:hypothetical protein
VSRREPRSSSDGKVDVQCPQCAVRLRVRNEVLDAKIECSECHRVFIPRKAIGKRVARPDHAKLVLVIVAVVAAIVGVLIATSGGSAPRHADATPSAKGSK